MYVTLRLRVRVCCLLLHLWRLESVVCDRWTAGVQALDLFLGLGPPLAELSSEKKVLRGPIDVFGGGALQLGTIYSKAWR